MSSPSSVSVPVLSKQQTLIFPATFTRFGEIQYICDFRRRPRAKLVPIDSVAGNAGGTTIVIKSSARIMIICHGTWTFASGQMVQACLGLLTLSLINWIALAQKPIPASPARAPINRIESR